MTLPIQGMSAAATPVKQSGLVGMANMLTLMRKHSRKPVMIADFYCGEGENVVDGVHIKGSPISIMQGIAMAIGQMVDPPKQPRYIVFNDIVSGRVMDRLPGVVERWQSDMGLPVNHMRLTCYTKAGRPVVIPIAYRVGSAQTLCGDIESSINHGFHVIALIDPNGPKDAPWSELRSLYDRRGNSLEVIIHISANTLKRVAKAREVGYNFAPMPDHISGMLSAFDGAGGWVREPVGADQWTLLLLSKFPPRNGWNPKTGPRFLRIDDDNGRELIQYLSTTAKEREQMQ